MILFYTQLMSKYISTYTEDHCLYNEYSLIKKNKKKIKKKIKKA